MAGFLFVLLLCLLQTYKKEKEKKRKRKRQKKSPPPTDQQYATFSFMTVTSVHKSSPLFLVQANLNAHSGIRGMSPCRVQHENNQSYTVEPFFIMRYIYTNHPKNQSGFKLKSGLLSFSFYMNKNENNNNSICSSLIKGWSLTRGFTVTKPVT